MHDCCAAANLPPLFTEGALPEEIRELWPAFEKAFRSDSRGTLLNDIFAFGESAAVKVLLGSPQQKVDESAFNLAKMTLGALDSGRLPAPFIR